MRKNYIEEIKIDEGDMEDDEDFKDEEGGDDDDEDYEYDQALYEHEQLEDVDFEWALLLYLCLIKSNYSLTWWII